MSPVGFAVRLVAVAAMGVSPVDSLIRGATCHRRRHFRRIPYFYFVDRHFHRILAVDRTLPSGAPSHSRQLASILLLHLLFDSDRGKAKVVDRVPPKRQLLIEYPETDEDDESEDVEMEDYEHETEEGLDGVEGKDVDLEQETDEENSDEGKNVEEENEADEREDEDISI